MTPVDILILSNGPGEVTTWVRPVVKALRQQLGDDRSVVRISVVLSPCPNATGKEAAIALSYPEVDRVQPAEHFWQFFLWGKTFANWDWRSHGVVVFLGGDQIFPVVIGKKLGYRTVVYAEWEARWHNFIDRFGVMKPQVAVGVSPKYAHKFTVVGDLMLEAQEQTLTPNSSLNTELIGLLPGSKAAKLTQGIPLMLAIAEHIHTSRPQTKFVIPVAPTVDLQTLASFGDSQKNPFVKTFGIGSVSLIIPQDKTTKPSLKTQTGLTVELCQENPAYNLLSQCQICLTTVGANTAELGALGVPMIVLLPTQQLDAMRSWDGLPGLLANLPGVGSTFAKVINWVFLRRKGLLAWPNIWAQQEIVPELVGKLQAPEIGDIVLDFLAHPQKLEAIRDKLRQVRGESGAAQKLATLVKEEMGK
ncbi:lipid-A-disaccharide synthase [Nostoc linckia z18]|uniref:Lipid-A-disaccharide synthase n=2 Tax=Nostoc linckia TaxID=92942 RepID=A0A9Q5Z7B1_NOSLI|nr:lipid-A-disaccharide synthase [Nostoc linckia]PHK38434.1 lipid-A-disaccharide synthase [Nostoc linckia z15]PHK43424.1 lipid-A-disaccharide synthase [Nostoc linckia z16]PHJ67045.1 lipid-A-disaccharide synthase [Nostoc linckia z1]PHJ67779.1 lipid-A-disaccharide synthase [Nostoc linckia z3]PHJ77310.1 lipid-A-disaccharide synthase [Nostoc linckia z2]